MADIEGAVGVRISGLRISARFDSAASSKQAAPAPTEPSIKSAKRTIRMALDTTEGPRKISGEKLALGALFAEISLRLRSYRQRFGNSVKARQRRARSKG
jgi:hypothetical protein